MSRPSFLPPARQSLVAATTAAAIALAASAPAFAAPARPAGPATEIVGPKASKFLIQVKFRDGTAVDADGQLEFKRSSLQDRIDTILGGKIAKVAPVFHQDPAKLDALHDQLEAKGKDVQDLTTYVQLRIKSNQDPDKILAQLKADPQVETAYVEQTQYRVPAATAPAGSSAKAAAAASTPLYQAQQADMWSAAPNGMGITPALTTNGAPTPGIGGNLVNVTDYEGGYFTGSAALSSPTSNISNEAPMSEGSEHATLVASTIAGVDTTGIGASGIAPKATYRNHFWNSLRGTGATATTLAAILDAAGPGSNLGAGDVFLTEITAVNNAPIESSPSLFAALQILTARGVIVIEPAGNGGLNYDAKEWSSWAQNGDSGAILVGAGNQQQLVGGATTPGSQVRCDDQYDTTWVSANKLGRYKYSGYGRRVDVQGPNCVPAANDNGTGYVGTFNGTSSASAVIAGVTTALSSAYEARTGTTLTPGAARDALKATGTQPSAAAEADGHIGPMVNLAGAIDYLKATHTKPVISAPALPLRNANGSYTLSATVNPKGLSTTTKIQYGTTTSYGSTLTTQTVAAGAAATVSGTTGVIATGATIHYRIVATNSDGVVNGPDQVFTAYATTKPVVLATTDGGGAEWRDVEGKYVLFGRVGSGGLATTTSISYKAVGDANYTTVPTQSLPARASDVTAAQQVVATNSLTFVTGTTYTFHTTATNALGTTVGPELTLKAGFTPLITLYGSPAYNNTTRKYTLSNRVYGNGEATTANRFEWTASPSFNANRPVYDKTEPLNVAVGPLENKQVTAVMSGPALTPGTVVHYRTVANNWWGDSRGPDQQFVVKATPVVTAAQIPVRISDGVYRLSGKVDPAGLPTTTRIEYGADAYYFSETAQSVPVGPIQTVTALTNEAVVYTGTTFHYRVVATNALGTTYGPDQVWSPTTKPVVTPAAAPVRIADGVYRLSGTVDPAGLQTTTRIEYGEGQYYFQFSGPLVAAGPPQAVTVLTDEATVFPGQVVQYRTVAVNALGTTYGPQQTFTAS